MANQSLLSIVSWVFHSTAARLQVVNSSRNLQLRTPSPRAGLGLCLDDLMGCAGAGNRPSSRDEAPHNPHISDGRSHPEQYTVELLKHTSCIQLVRRTAAGKSPGQVRLVVRNVERASVYGLPSLSAAATPAAAAAMSPSVQRLPWSRLLCRGDTRCGQQVSPPERRRPLCRRATFQSPAPYMARRAPRATTCRRPPPSTRRSAAAADAADDDSPGGPTHITRTSPSLATYHGIRDRPVV